MKRTHFISLVAGVTLLLACPARAESGQDPEEDLRPLNTAVIRLMEEASQAPEAAREALSQQAADLLARRAEKLARLMARSPGKALRQALPPEAAAAVAREFPGSAHQVEAYGEWRGVLSTWVQDDTKLASGRTIRKLSTGGQEFEVLAADVDQLPAESGEAVVAGFQLDGLIAAPSIELLATTPSCSNTGLQNTAVILVTAPGVDPPAGVTPQSVSDIFFGASEPTVNGYVRETSMGRTSMAGRVSGWHTLSRAYTCGDQAMLAEAITMASREIDFNGVTRIFIVHTDSTCGAGYAQSGCLTVNFPGGSTVASVAWLLGRHFANRVSGVQLAVHEFGHNLYMGHSGTREFASEPLGPLGVLGTTTEQGDYFSSLGVWTTAHYPAQFKARAGWLDAGSQYATVQGNGTWTIEPASAPSTGLKALKIQRGTGNNAWLWLEYRQPIGVYESGLPQQVYSGATIRYEDSYTGWASHLLDFTRSTTSFTDPALTPGSTWTDPYSNVSITVLGASAAGLTVNVSYGAAACTRNNPRLTVSPASASATAGQSANYQLTITNNDSAACSPAAFSLAASVPSGWGSSFSPASVTVSPGGSATVSWTVQVPAGAATGSYAVSASAASGAYQAGVAATCTVSAPQALEVSLALPQAAYSARDTVTATATVKLGGAPLAGAAVSFTLRKPNGATAAGKATSGADGTAVWKYRLGPKDPAGLYSISARVTAGSQSADSAPLSFTVR